MSRARDTGDGYRGGRGNQGYNNAGRAGGGGGRDRLGELKSVVGARPASLLDDNRSTHDLTAHRKGGRGDGTVAQVLEGIKILDQELSRSRQDMSYIRKLQGRSLEAANEEVSRTAARDQEEASYELRQQVARLKKKLGDLEQVALSLESGTADRVMATNQIVAFKSKFQTFVKEFQGLESGYADAHKRRMLREMRLVQPNATEDDVDRAIESGNLQVFSQAVKNSAKYREAKGVLSRVQDRQTQIQRIEQSVEELAQLFLDLNTAIEQQDYVLEEVTKHVDEAVVNLEEGEKEVETAIVHRKKHLKLLWCLCVLVLLVIAAVVIFILMKYTNVLGNTSSSQT